MMDIVVLGNEQNGYPLRRTHIAPPTQTQTPNPIGYCHSYHSVPPPISRDAGVSSIVRQDWGQHDWRLWLTGQLMKHEPQECGGSHLP